MKTHGKLKINSEKNLNNLELEDLVGGAIFTCRVVCNQVEVFSGPAEGDDLMDAQGDCTVYWNQYGSGCLCYCQ